MLELGISPIIDWLNNGLKNDAKINLLTRKLELECTYNRSLIDCLKMDDIDQKSREALKVASLMETTFLEIYQLEKIQNKSLYKSITDSNKDISDLENNDLIDNIVLKIKLLKAINELPFEEKHGYKDFRIKVRLNNLSKKLKALSEEIELLKTPENKKLSLN